jgi:hypothetical protein
MRLQKLDNQKTAKKGEHNGPTQNKSPPCLKKLALEKMFKKMGKD